ncbi:hypothetical protein DFH27DRAFT_528735 [Peziza echinospora]|nr:hypothetical protein DFH27DRAFT_528735 [Peziza echinospora]
MDTETPRIKIRRWKHELSQASRSTPHNRDTNCVGHENTYQGAQGKKKILMYAFGIIIMIVIIIIMYDILGCSCCRVDVPYAYYAYAYCLFLNLANNFDAHAEDAAH